jgi:PAS domain S-box-containing protein
VAIKDERGRRSQEGPTVDLGIANLRVPIGSHLARLWETDEDFSEALGFVLAGLRGSDSGSDRCVVIGDGGDNEWTLRLLRERGVEVDRAVEMRRLVVIEREPTARAMLESVTAAFDAAIAEGAAGIRLFGNVGWSRKAGPADAELSVYEAGLNDLARRFPVVILCLHPVRALSGPIARDGVLATHDRIVDQGRVAENPFFVPPETFAQGLEAIAAQLALRQGDDEARRRSSEILHAIFDNIPLMISYMDSSGRFLLVNREWERVLGWSLEEAQRIDVLSRLHPNPERRRRVEEFIRSAEGRWEDFLVTTRGGEALETSWFRTALSDGTSIGLGLDVTERRLAEEALRESEERYRTLFESGPLPKILYDPESLRIVAVNEPAVAHYGYSREEFLRMTILDYRPADDAAKIRAFVHESHPTLWNAGVWRHIRKDGTLLFADVTVTQVVIHGRRLYLANIFDVTERRLTAESLAQSYQELRGLSERLRIVREEERARIAREVHDEVGQALTALRIEAAWLERKLEAGERSSLEAKLRSMSELIDTTLSAVQRIATDLRPAVLDELGLEAAIEWYVREFEERTGIACRFHSDRVGDPTDPERATAAFRILQEALTNVARHAGASRAEVRLSSDSEKLRLEVRDDGRGIPKEGVESSTSLGLIGMRERARALGGDVAIVGATGRGTAVTLTIPL